MNFSEALRKNPSNRADYSYEKQLEAQKRSRELYFEMLESTLRLEKIAKFWLGQPLEETTEIWIGKK